MENKFTEIKISKGKKVILNSSISKNHEILILDPHNTVVCKSNYLVSKKNGDENTCFFTETSGDYKLVMKYNKEQKKLKLSEKSEIFTSSGLTKLYNFLCSPKSEISVIVQ